MKLDRNTAPDGAGKYIVINRRKLRDITSSAKDPFGRVAAEVINALDVLKGRGLLVDPDEYFVLMLKDEFAAVALATYAERARATDPEYADEVKELANASRDHPNRKVPD